MSDRDVSDDYPADLMAALQSIDNLRDQLDTAIALGNASSVSTISKALMQAAKQIDRHLPNGGSERACYGSKNRDVIKP